MKEAQILKAYEFAKERYAAIGVDTDKAVETLEKTPISLHCRARQASPAASRPPATIRAAPATSTRSGPTSSLPRASSRATTA